MELLLNSLWLMLALPALWIWRRAPVSAAKSAQSCRSRSIVLLGCLLALLFPVVSATDDLHPIRAEIEESSSSKRAVKQSPGAKPPLSSHDAGSPARPIQVVLFKPENETRTPIS